MDFFEKRKNCLRSRGTFTFAKCAAENIAIHGGYTCLGFVGIIATIRNVAIYRLSAQGAKTSSATVSDVCIFAKRLSQCKYSLT